MLFRTAADTLCTGFVSGAGLEDIVHVIQELKLIRKWFQSNRLSLKINKTSYMIFDRHEMDIWQT